MALKLLWLALAGAAGTLSRYALAGWVQRSAGSGFPWGTMAVNLAGCFLAGLVTALWEERGLFSGETRTVVMVGFMGAFTTFSSFILETGSLARDGEWLHAAANIAAQNTLGIVALLLGFAVARGL